MDKEEIIKRLTIVKLLYNIGLEQSKHSVYTSYISILSFHDAVEMFLLLVYEKTKELKLPNDISFMSYWEKIPTLQYKGAMKKLNDLRVGIKHKGITPSHDSFTETINSAGNFLYDSCTQFFNIDFHEITLFDLINFEDTRNHLKRAQLELMKNNFEGCVGEATNGFYKLLDQYKESKKSDDFSDNEYKFIEKLHFHKSFDADNKYDEIYTEFKKLSDKIDYNFSNVAKALDVLTLGIDYRKFAKFRIIVPHTYLNVDGNYISDGVRNLINKDNCLFLIDFVVESSLRLQDFDFTYNSLESN